MADNRMRRVFSTNLASLRGIAACMVVVFHSLLVFRIPGFDNPHRQSFAETVGWETVTLPLAWLSFVLMERPCQEAGRRIARLIETRRQVRRAAPLVIVRGSTTEPLE